MSSKDLASSTYSEPRDFEDFDYLDLNNNISHFKIHTIGSERALPTRPPSSIFSRGDHEQSNNNKEAPIGDNHSKISHFHKTQNICADLSVEKNDGVEYHNQNKKANNDVRNHKKQTPSTHSVNYMNYNCRTISIKRKRDKVKVEDGKKAGPRCHCTNDTIECLTLDCECFASELFCCEECGCDDDDCFNTPSLEDTVDTVKKNIRSINPSAFDKNNVRRGCNCNKSTCRKIDCPCFQARIACTEACHCQFCHNPYGERPDQASPSHGNISDASSRVD